VAHPCILASKYSELPIAIFIIHWLSDKLFCTIQTILCISDSSTNVKNIPSERHHKENRGHRPSRRSTPAEHFHKGCTSAYQSQQCIPLHPKYNRICKNPSRCFLALFYEMASQILYLAVYHFLSAGCVRWHGCSQIRTEYDYPCF